MSWPLSGIICCSEGQNESINLKMCYIIRNIKIRKEEIMNNAFLEYMQKRVKKEDVITKPHPSDLGPVITISREYGCPAKLIANRLADKINETIRKNHGKGHQWSWIGKEVLEESAKELHLKPELVKDIGESKETGLLNDILLTFSNKFYPGDIKIKRKIGEVIKVNAEKGNVIIVGRGGASICKHIPKSLHIRLRAPLEWRINEIAKRQNIDVDEAEMKIMEIDEKRELLFEFFEGVKADEYLFDVTYNVMALNENEIVESIMKILEMKKMI